MIRIDLEALTEMARSIYRVVHPLLGSSNGGIIVGRGFGGDNTRLIDRVAEETVIKYIRDKNIPCIFIGEENGILKFDDKADTYLVVDAIDGTTNAIRGLKFSSASLAAASSDSLKDIELAVVINLSDGNLYVAEKGKGAWLDGKRIKTSNVSDLSESIVNIDVSSTPERLEWIIPIMKAAKRIRSLGSTSLEICHVASGVMDAHIDLRGKIRTLDFAAAMLILKESGGTFGLLNGDEHDMEIPLTRLKRFSIIAAATEELYSQIISRIKNVVIR